MLHAFGMMSVCSDTNQPGRLTIRNSRLFESSKRAHLMATRSRLSADDYMSPLKGTSFYTDGQKYYRLLPNDPLISELQLTKHHPTQGTRWMFNGDRFFMSSLGSAPDHSILKTRSGFNRTYKDPDKIRRQRSEMCWFNDGVKNTKLNPADPRAAGLQRGRLMTASQLEQCSKNGQYKRTQETIDKKRNASQGTRVYNDGVKNYIISASQSPDPSWVPGRIVQNPYKPSEQSKRAARDRITGSKWYNNGVRNIRLLPNQEIPVGFHPGKLERHHLQSNT